MRPQHSANFQSGQRLSSTPSCSLRCQTGTLKAHRQRQPPFRLQFQQQFKPWPQQVCRGMLCLSSLQALCTHVNIISLDSGNAMASLMASILWLCITGEQRHASAAVTDPAITDITSTEGRKQLRLVFGTKVIPHPDKVTYDPLPIKPPSSKQQQERAASYLEAQ